MRRPELAIDPRRISDESAPCFARWRKCVAAAEQGAGWLAECADAGRFLAVSQELVDALTSVLRRLAGNGPVLEVCAGSGELARAMGVAGVDVEATDLKASPGTGVRPMSAEAALRHFQPKVVLGAFVPIDSGVDEAVLTCPSVRHYLVLNARIGALLGAPALWQTTGWTAEPLETLRPWMLTRHDVWLGTLDLPSQPGCPAHQIPNPFGPQTNRPRHPHGPSEDLLQHGEAWLFTRISSTSPAAGRALR